MDLKSKPDANPSEAEKEALDKNLSEVDLQIKQVKSRKNDKS